MLVVTFQRILTFIKKRLYGRCHRISGRFRNIHLTGVKLGCICVRQEKSRRENEIMRKVEEKGSISKR